WERYLCIRHACCCSGAALHNASIGIRGDYVDPILESLTEFATGLSYRDLPSSVVTAAGERVMDALGCAVGAYEGDTVRIARSLAGPAAPGALAGRLLGSSDTAA